jgi:hypothetical protein
VLCLLISALHLGGCKFALAGQCTAEEWAADPCKWARDGECDVPSYCPSGDCVDCDPCSAAPLGCSGCLATAGCEWLRVVRSYRNLLVNICDSSSRMFGGSVGGRRMPENDGEWEWLVF